MSLLDTLRRVFKSGTAGFNDFEKAVLAHILDELPADQRSRLQHRIESVNLVQRLDGGREVNCFAMRNGRPVLEQETRLDAAEGERSLARFIVEGDRVTENSGQAWLVDGNLFSLEFDQPTEHASPGGITSIRVTLADLGGTTNQALPLA